MEVGYLFVKLSYVVVVYRSGVQINGLSPDEILLFIGTFVTLTAAYAGLFMINNFGLRTKIRDGDLDLLLTKPVSLQFMATLRQADLTLFSVDAIAGLTMVGIAWARLGPPRSICSQWAVMRPFCCSGTVCELLPVPAAANSLVLVDQHQRHRRSDRLVLGFQQYADGNLRPLDQADRGVHPAHFRHLPTSRPCSSWARCPSIYLAWSAILPLILLALVRVAWKRGLRNYASASS